MPLPQFRKGISLLVIVSFLLLFLEGNAQYTWRKKACLPGTDRAGIGNFSIGNKGYVICGFTYNDLADVISEVWEYDEPTNIWTKKNNFGTALAVPTCFVINNVAYCGLGQDISGNFHSDFYKYNQATDTWIRIADFPGQARYTALAFVINGKAYVGCGKGGGLYDDFYTYDPASNSWSTIASFPSPMQTGIACAIGNIGYCGLGNDGGYLNNLYKYDPVVDQWSPLSNLPFGGIDALSCFVIDSVLYTAAGRDANNFYTECWSYHPTTDSWMMEQNFSCMNPGRATWEGFTINGHGYVTCGGQDDVIYFNDLLEFGPLDMTFVTRVHILGNDTSYCNTFSRLLSTGNPCTLWSTGVTASQITVTTPGTYWAYWADSCGMVSDTIHITQGAPTPFNLGNDTSYCGNFSLILSTGEPTTVWSTGITASQITVSAPGTYWATINTCGLATDTIQIFQKPGPIVDLGHDTTLCTGGTLLLDATNANSTYLWQDNSTNPTYTVSSAGSYSVTVSNSSGCSASGSIIVEKGIPNVNLGNDTSICGAGVILNIPIVDAQFHWQDNSTDSLYRVLTSGTYSVTVTNNCGASYGHVAIDIHTDDCRLNLPTAFSPNGDGKNDYFHALCQCPVKNFSMRIFNRWGETVYQTQNFTDGWDGTYLAIPQPLGVFVYLIQYFNECENRLKTITGNFTLLR